MSISERGLNRATLARQLLLRREPLDVPEAVRKVVALQAQEAASPYLALWNRVAGFDAADLDAAFAEHVVVKATLMRITLHAVHAEDYPAFHAAMRQTLRASRLNDGRFTGTGLTAADVDALVPELLEFAQEPRTNADFEELLAKRVGEVAKPGPWWALRSFTPLWHAPGGGAWSFGRRPAYVAAASASVDDEEESLRVLVRRYLEGFGPATVADVSQFALVPRARVRSALTGMLGTLERLEGPGGIELIDVPDGPRPDADVPAPPRLMAMWDSMLLAYAERGRIIPPAYRPQVIRRNGDVLPTLLVDGYVAGVWRPVTGGIEATAFHPLGSETWEVLEEEARRLVAFLGEREPTAYRRYGRWWDQIAGAELRVLGG